MVFKLKKSFKLIFSIFVAVVLLAGLLACEEDNNTKLDMNVVYSDITNSCKLTLDYENGHFFNTGVGKAELRSVADGDTASFALEDGTYFRIRFYGIDTPESTGKVQKWGKAASMFTKAALENAYEIVIESSTGKEPVTDSYGERYLGYIWYRNSATDEFKNLNLHLVENGYSQNNCQNTINYKYYSYFEKAEKFAEKGKLRTWGHDKDELFSDKAIATDLRELNKDIYAFYNEELAVGSKISFDAIMIALSVGDSGTHMWTAAQIIDGVVYTFDIYGGYDSSTVNSSCLKVGNLYHVEGYVDNYYGKFQINGLAYLNNKKTEGLTYTIQQSVGMLLSDSIEYTFNYRPNLKTAGTITAAELVDSILNLTVTTQTKTNKGISNEVETYNIKINNVASDYDATQLLNKKVNGFFYLSENGEYYYTPNINSLTFE